MALCHSMWLHIHLYQHIRTHLYIQVILFIAIMCLIILKYRHINWPGVFTFTKYIFLMYSVMLSKPIQSTVLHAGATTLGIVTLFLFCLLLHFFLMTSMVLSLGLGSFGVRSNVVAGQLLFRQKQNKKEAWCHLEVFLQCFVFFQSASHLTL